MLLVDKDKLKEYRRRLKKESRMWVRLALLHGVKISVYEDLLKELVSEDAPAYKNYLRLDVKLF